MKKIIVFAGTYEGRKICEFLAENSVPVTACVATEYGSMTLPQLPYLTIKEGRLQLFEIAALIEQYDVVIDATHPYAQVISENIKAAVSQKGKTYIRIIRPAIGYENVIECSDIQEACKYLNDTEGNILITTGSKELKPYTSIKNYENRLFLRVLPTIDALNKCFELGFHASNIICMQGPFSEKLNIAMLESINANYLVTKETGKSGGFEQKLEAAKKMGVKMILIGRPQKEDGLSLAQTCEFLKNELKLRDSSFSHFPAFIDLKSKKIVIVGCGVIGTRRIKTLLKFNANITVIASEISDEIRSLGDNLCIFEKNYEERDIEGAFMVIAATDNREVNQKIYEDAKKRSILVNIADKKEQSDFYFPAIFNDEDIIGGLISRNGDNHKCAKEKAKFISDYLNNRR